MNERVITCVEDVRSLMSQVCCVKGISGYAVEQSIADQGLSNASGARHFVQGRSPTVTIDTLIKLCDCLRLKLVIREQERVRKDQPKRSDWDWEAHQPAYQRLLTGPSQTDTINAS